jgi:hypothetical protein
MLDKILQILRLSCPHKNMSHPFATAVTASNGTRGDWDTVAPAAGHYIVCLDCGRKFNYDWKNMRMVK